MTSKIYAVLGFLVAVLAAGSSEAGCKGWKATVTAIGGDPASAALVHDNQNFPVRPGQRVCGGDVLVAGPGTTIVVKYVEGQVERVSGRRMRFSESEGQADSALDADTAADNVPH